jgi:hypothetical protein
MTEQSIAERAGWDPATESNPSPDETMDMTVQEVIGGLMAVARTHPDTEHAMEIARAMLTRLDTIRDEIKFKTTFGKDATARGDIRKAAEKFDDIHRMTGTWTTKHRLAVRTRG